MDLIFIDERPAIKVLDEGTHMSADQFIPNKSSKSDWSTFLKCWCDIYIGIPKRILVDQGTEFGNTFVHLAADSGT